MGKLDLSAGVTSYSDLRGTAKGTFDWKIQPDQRAAGSLDVNNDGKNALVVVQLAQPTTLSLNGTVATHDDAYPWTATLHVPKFDPRKLTHDDTLQIRRARSHRQRRPHARQGHCHARSQHAHCRARSAAICARRQEAHRSRRVRIHSPEAQGVLTAKGVVQLDTNPIAGDAQIDWSDVELPADLVGQPLATHGTLHAGGSAAKFSASGDFSLGPPGKLADISLALDGTQKSIDLHKFALKQPKGDLVVTGNVQLQPQVQWQLESTAHHFDPGAFAKEWPGSIDLALSTNGKVEKSRSVRHRQDRQTLRHAAPASAQRQRRSHLRLAARGERHARPEIRQQLDRRQRQGRGSNRHHRRTRHRQPQRLGTADQRQPARHPRCEGQMARARREGESRRREDRVRRFAHRESRHCRGREGHQVAERFASTSPRKNSAAATTPSTP